MDKSFDFIPIKEDAFQNKKTLGSFIGNMGLIVAALTLICTCATFFTDISLASVMTVEFSLSFIILLFCSYTMYFSMADTGARRGAQDEEFLNAKKQYEELRGELEASGGIFSLGEFCHKYTASELISSQKSILLSAGISYREFEENYKGVEKKDLPRELGKKRIKIISRANSIKPIVLTPDMLLSAGRKSHARNPLAKAPEKQRALHAIGALLPTTLTSFFAVSVVCSIINEPTMATVTECIIKLFALIWNGTKGYAMGYNNISREASEYLLGRCQVLSSAISEAKKEAKNTEAKKEK